MEDKNIRLAAVYTGLTSAGLYLLVTRDYVDILAGAGAGLAAMFLTPVSMAGIGMGLFAPAISTFFALYLRGVPPEWSFLGSGISFGAFIGTSVYGIATWGISG